MVYYGFNNSDSSRMLPLSWGFLKKKEVVSRVGSVICQVASFENRAGKGRGVSKITHI